MDIEKLIERFEYDAKDWAGDPHIKRDLLDAATALSTLQAENEKLRAELKQVKEERDAAVADLEHLMLVVNSGECCMMCKHDHEHLTGPCAGQSTRCEPEWRGPKKED